MSSWPRKTTPSFFSLTQQIVTECLLGQDAVLGSGDTTGKKQPEILSLYVPGRVYILEKQTINK